MMMMDDEGLELDPFDSSTIVPDDREPLIRGKHDTLRQKFTFVPSILDFHTLNQVCSN